MLPVAMLALTVLQHLSRRHVWAGLLFRGAAAIIGFAPLVIAGYFSAFRMIDEGSFTWWLLVAGGCAMAVYQAWRALLYFDQKWQAHHEKAFAFCLDPASGTLDVNSLFWKLQVEMTLFLPESDKNKIRAGWATLALLVAVSRDVWEIGLFFFFIFSLLGLVVLLYLFQLAVFHCLLAAKLRSIEVATGKPLSPMSGLELETATLRRRKAKAAAKSKAKAKRR